MASTTLQYCTPLLVGRGCEGSCLRGTALTPKSNSYSRAVDANFRCPGFVGLEKAVHNGGLKRSISKSSSLGGSVDLPQHFGSDVLPYSGWKRSNSSHALPLQALAVQAPEAIEKLPVNVEMLETYDVEEKVRDYELDHYGVVNNAIYAQFCQHDELDLSEFRQYALQFYICFPPRTELLENIGFSPDAITESGKAMAISDMSMKFIFPLRSGDRYIVSSRVAGTTAVRLIFEDHIYRLPERELVMSARSTVVVLDQNSKPGRLPDEIKAKLVNGYSTNFHVKGKTTNGHIKGHSKNGQISSTSTSGLNVNGNSMSGSVSGDSTTGHINGDSRTAHVNGCPTDVYVDANLRTREVSLVA